MTSRLPAELGRRRGDGHAGDPGRCASTSRRAELRRRRASRTSRTCSPAAPWFDDVILFDKRGPREHAALAVARKLRANRPDAGRAVPEFVPLGAARAARRLPAASSASPATAAGCCSPTRCTPETRRPRPARAVARSSTTTTGSPSRSARPTPATGWSCSPRPPTRRPRTRCGTRFGLHRYPRGGRPEPRGGVRRGEALAGRSVRRNWPGCSPTGAAAACWCCAGRPSATWPGEIAGRQPQPAGVFSLGRQRRCRSG